MSYRWGKKKKKKAAICCSQGYFVGHFVGILHTEYSTICEPFTSSQDSQRLEGTRCISPIPGEDPVGLGLLQFFLFAQISIKHFGLHQTPPVRSSTVPH